MNTTAQRQDFADELRGFALLGIVLVNVPFLGISGQGFTEAAVAATGDRVAAFLTVALAQAKFYLLFAFLFGYSMSFLVRSGDGSSRRRFMRRLLGLAVLGVLHAVWLFVGDILLLYGLLGTALLVMHQWRNAALLRFAVAVGLLWMAMLAMVAMAPADPSQSGVLMERVAAFDAAMASGTWREAAAARLSFWPLAAVVIGLLNGLPVLAMFALGLLAGRKKLLAQPDAHAPLWRHARSIGTLLGLPLSFWGAWLSVGPGAQLGSTGMRETAGLVLGFVSAPLLSWAYVGWLLRLRQRVPGGLRWFRPAGRMSLSGYLGESLLLSLVFCAYGLGLFGQLGAARVALIGLLVWVVLDLLAHVIQRFAARGPAEWLLRRFTAA
jgi:uncharacterized protein